MVARWGRLLSAVRAAWPTGAAGRVLAALLILGIGLRLLAIISLWPVTITLEDGYQNYAKSNPLMDPLHPAGYSMLLAVIGLVTHEVFVPVLLQHVAGIATALLLGAATRRISGSTWAGLIPAAVILLDPDVVFLEQSIMSETTAMFVMAVGLYAAARAFDAPEPWWRWPLLSGVALAAAAVIRDAQLLMIPVVVVALALARPRRAPGSPPRWRAPAATAAAAVVVLLAYASLNGIAGPRFGIAPSPGWYLYGRVAQFADCSKFTPPAGTESLCQKTPLSQRRSGYYYMYDPQAPAERLFGSFGHDDGLIGEWAQRALRAQVGQFVTTAWTYFRSYWVPGSRPARLLSSTELDPQLDFTFKGNAIIDAVQKLDLEHYFDPFKAHRVSWGLKVLRAWQRVIRFGTAALWVTTLLTLIGLAVGTRRSRAGVLLFGVGGVALIVAPSLTSTYSGRYTVPMAGPLVAAAAITLTELWRARTARAANR